MPSLRPLSFLLVLAALASAPVASLSAAAPARSWTADNGNGTFTNPLFYDEFSDPDLIRVGEDFYLAGTTMHAMPGLVVLHSRDLVNWRFLSYAFDRLTLGPEFDLVEGREAYGQGIWAPCIRYHEGTFYIFSNVNGHGMQVFTATDPAGPWEHRPFGGEVYDLSVLFDDDGRIYAVHGYDEVRLVELKPDLSGPIEGTDRVIIPAGNAMGEGHHFYKIDGKYYIISANYAPVGRMQCARADHPEGPYETVVISMRETFGTQRGWLTNTAGLGRGLPELGTRFTLEPVADSFTGAVPLHQGGIVDLPNGEWWGFSMIDFRSVGRTTCLSPVTWHDGWPYFGLPGNLGRSPRTWFKPAVAAEVEPHAPYERSDSFDGASLQPVWQWNHNPKDARWSLTEKPGVLRLHTLPADQFLRARNSLTQRVIGPVSTATAQLDASGLQVGDVAGLGLLNLPAAWLGVLRTEGGYTLRWYHQETDTTRDAPLDRPQVWLRATYQADDDLAQLSYSLDGQMFTDVGTPVRLPYQLKTFQGTRLALFAYNTRGQPGGFADFAAFTVEEPLADRSGNLPVGKTITLTNLGNQQVAWANPHGMLHSAPAQSERGQGAQARFRVLDRGQGTVVLQSVATGKYVTVVGLGLSADVRLMDEELPESRLLWQDMLRGQCMLLSLATHRYLGIDPGTGEPYAADWPGTRPNRQDGTVFTWQVVAE